jgi:hypothetical protein
LYRRIFKILKRGTPEHWTRWGGGGGNVARIKKINERKAINSIGGLQNIGQDIGQVICRILDRRHQNNGDEDDNYRTGGQRNPT